MTAEIAILNKSAVALAADSKVTISGGRAAKTYDTVNKVFTLSKVHPVGIMIFGNAEFMDYPWETIIKLYRKEKGSSSETHIEKWGEDFEKYLRAFGKIEDRHKAENIGKIVGSWLYQMRDLAEMAAISRGHPVPSDEHNAILLDMLRKKKEELSSDPMFFSKAKSRAIFKKHLGLIASTVSDYFGGNQDDDVFKEAIQFAAVALVSSEMSPQSSGFVVAGFGDKEYFPTVVEYNTDGYVDSAVKVVKTDVSEITRDNGSCIRAFAQGDMVQRFMNGADHTLMQVLFNSFGTMLAENCMTVLNDYGSAKNKSQANRDKILDGVGKGLEQFQEDVLKYISNNFSNPVIDMVALLPKDELAHLAESLVALTSLKRRVSSDAETVGGPVDVALISKGDGFVWVKRKNYFSRDLNPEFMRNYMYDLQNGGTHHAE